MGHVGNPKFEFDIEYIVKLCKEYNKLIEINSSSFNVRKGSYPICREVALACKKYETNIIVTSDAHSMYKVGDHKDAVDMLESIDFPENLILNTDYDRLMEYLNIRKMIVLFFDCKFTCFLYRSYLRNRRRCYNKACA